MLKFARLSLVIAMSALLLAGFGCASNNETQAPVQQKATSDSGLKDAMALIEKKTVSYPFDRFDLNNDSKAILKEKAELMKQYPQIGTTVEGHCDERGTEEYNLALGERRAKAAYDYLVMMGVPADQLSTISYGKMRPAVEGTGEPVWSQNRRTQYRTKLLNK